MKELSLFCTAEQDPVLYQMAHAIVEKGRAENRMILVQMYAELDRDILTRLRTKKLIHALKKVGVMG